MGFCVTSKVGQVGLRNNQLHLFGTVLDCSHLLALQDHARVRGQSYFKYLPSKVSKLEVQMLVNLGDALKVEKLLFHQPLGPYMPICGNAVQRRLVLRARCRVGGTAGPYSLESLFKCYRITIPDETSKSNQRP